MGRMPLLAMLVAGTLIAPSAALAQTGAEDGVPRAVEAALGGEVTDTDSGLYRVETDEGQPLTTHGPDFRDAVPYPKAAHGTGLGPGDPERMPVCAAPATARYQEILYGYWDPAGADPGTSRLTSVREGIRGAIRRMNAVLASRLDCQRRRGRGLHRPLRQRREIRVTAFPVTTASGTDRATFADVKNAAG